MLSLSPGRRHSPVDGNGSGRNSPLAGFWREGTECLVPLPDVAKAVGETQATGLLAGRKPLG